MPHLFLNKPYPRFTRFEARAFLLEAARFMAGVCPVCIIDNTSVPLAAGAGADAVIAPEIAAFARTLGFGLRAHRVGNPDRKGRIERPFAYVETNFLVGRNFADLDDLNRQALAWRRDTANRKPKQALGMSPEAAYVIEQPHLVPLPEAASTSPPTTSVASCSRRSRSGARSPRHARYSALRVAPRCSAPRLTAAARGAV